MSSSPSKENQAAAPSSMVGFTSTAGTGTSGVHWPRFKDLTVLIVDDEPGIRESLAEALEGRWKILMASSGEEALKLIESHRPEIILTYQRMSPMEGMTLLELVIEGVETSREFHLRVMEDPDFRAGTIDIQWLERRLPSLLGGRPREDELHAAAIAAALIADRDRHGVTVSTAASAAGSAAAPSAAPPPEASAWARAGREGGLRAR